jgi:tetratricopeptide (TPR) repeat protein
VTIFYHRPGVKGREIWGKLLPYGEIWRAGANEPTLFTFSDEVMIEGKKLNAGTYRFVTIPGPKEWTVIFNSETKNWGTVYEPQYDTLRFTVTPETGPQEEWLSYSFTDLTPSSARVVLAWEKMRIGFKIEFNTLAKMQSSVGTWQVLNAAAGYALSQKIYLNEAMGWIARSIALDKNPRNLQTKADLLAEAGKVDDAIATAEEAVKLAKQRNPNANTSGLEKRISDWKAKK